MIITDMAVNGVQKEIERMQRRADKIHHLLFGDPFKANIKEDMDYMIEYQKTKTVSGSEEWSKLTIEIQKTREWLKHQVWLKNKKS